MNRKNRSIFASLVVLALFGVLGGCRETPITSKPNIPTVFVGEINGIVRDGSTGAPLNNVTVTLLGTATDAGGANPITTTTDANGLYVFRNLDAGIYKIAATAPAGYAPTRVQDGPELRPLTGTNEGGVVVTRTARDIRFFTSNASVTATAVYTTPTGQVLPVPVGTPVFVNFSRVETSDAQATVPAGQNPTGETIGDVQVALVRDSVRAGGVINITGLPAVGVLADIDLSHRPLLIVPNFTVGGVTYGAPNGRAIEYRIAGLRPAAAAIVSPTVTTVSALASPTALVATNLNSRTNFGTTDTMVVAFNKSMTSTIFRLARVRTPYADAGLSEGMDNVIASTTAGSLTATPVAVGTTVGGITATGANQVFAIRLNRPFVTGTDHRLDYEVTAADGTTLSATSTSSTATLGVRSFTTVAGLRLLSVTAGGATPVTLSATTTTSGVPTSGNITFTFDRAPVGQYFTRGALRNVRFASGSTIPGTGTAELGRVGIAGETNRIDCVGVITGNNLTFGYRSLVGATPNSQVGTIYQIHASLVTVGPADQPIVNEPQVAPGTLGNFRSATPGDFGVVAVLSNRASEFSSFRVFAPTVNPINIPRIVSVQMPRNPRDSVRVAFSIPMRRTGGVVNTTNGFRLFRSDVAYNAVGVPGTTQINQPYGSTTDFPVGPSNTIPITITSSSGDTVFFLNRNQRRDVNGDSISFEGNTSYTFQIDDDLESAGGVRLRGDGDTLSGGWFTFQGRTAGQTFAGATVGSVNIVGENTRVPISGNIELRFSRPIRQDVDYKTRGLGQNFELVRISAVGNPGVAVAPTTADLGPNPTTVFIDATGAKTTDAITFGYRGLHRRTRYALRAISPAPGDFFSTTVNLADIPEAFYNVRWADFPNDPGVGFTTTATGTNVPYNDATGNRLNVQFVTQEADPARVIASSTDANPTAFPLVIDSTVQTSLTNPIRLTFSKEMERNAGGAFTLTAVASPYFATPYTIPLKATWNAAGTEVSLVPNINVSGDTARTLEAGTTYELTISTSGFGAVDGGALVPLIRPITFTTQPETRLVGVAVRGNTFSATPGLPINAGDTVGTITLTFSKNIGGRYNVRGPQRRFIIREDSSGTDLTGFNFGPTPGAPDSVNADFVDSLSTVTNNTLTFNYRITRKRLKGRNVAENPTSDATTYLQNRIVRVSLISTSFGGVDYNNLLAQPNPQNIRGRVRGDLGVRGEASLPQVTTYSGLSFGTLPRPTLNPDDYLNDKPSFNRFGPGNIGVTEFAFYFSTGGTPTSQSFPDLVVSSVRNAAESVSQAAKQTVSTVRGWWKRFRGE